MGNDGNEKTLEAKAATESQAKVAETTEEGTKTPEDREEKLNAFQRFMNSLFGEKSDETDDAKKTEGTEKTEDKKTAEPEKTFTQSDIDAAIEAARQKWDAEAAEKKRVEKLTPEEKEKEEQRKKDTELKTLRAELLKKELKEQAVKKLQESGDPIGLAELLRYESAEEMEKSYEHTIKTFRDCFSSAITERLKGKTPEGLGRSAAGESLLREQIAKNVRG